MISDSILKPSIAAVVVLYDKSTGSLILTKRSSLLRNHPGEICFPGGLREEGDENLYATALRELHEELNIASYRVKLITALKPVNTRLDTLIYPWLAEIESINPYQMNVDEVVDVISLPIDSVVKKENYQSISIHKGCYRFKSIRFIPHKEFIWGATAKIMQQLCNECCSLNYKA